MKAYSYLLTALSVLAVITGCQNEQATKDQGPAKEIAFKAALGKYEVKATDTAFEEGDVVGLFAADPVSANNVALTWDGETVKPEEPLFWGLEQAGDEASAFYAYYPYSEEVESTLFTFSVPEDQSDEEEYKAADLLTASALGTPDVGEVYLRFAHQLTRAIFVIDATALGSEVESVVVEPIKLDADVDLTIPLVEVSQDAEESYVKAAPLIKADGTKAWGVIVPPQEISDLMLRITLENGEEYILEQEEVYLEAGVSYTVHILLDETAIPISFEFEVFDWIDAGGYYFFGKGYDPGPHEHIWSIRTYEDTYPMTLKEDGLYYGALSGSGSYEFQIVREDLGTYWGQAVDHYLEVGEEGVETVIAPNGNWMYAWCESGAIQVILDAVRKVITLKPLPPQWESIGTGLMVESFIADFDSQVNHVEFEVEVEKDANSDTYRIVDPYKNWPYLGISDYYTLQDGGEIIIKVDQNNNCYVKESKIGLTDVEYGDITVIGLVPENGVEDYYNYGYYNEKNGYLKFGGEIGMMLSNYDKVMFVNRDSMFALTLPGFTRPELYSGIRLEMKEQVVDDAGQNWVVLDVFTGMDVEALRYGVYFGKLSYDEVYGTDGVYFDVQENGTEVENVPDGWVELRLPVNQTGTYTIVFDKLVNGKHSGLFDTHGVVIEGQELPELNISVEAILDETNGDTQAKIVYFFSNPKEIYILLEEESKIVEDGVTEETMYDYTLTNGQRLSTAYVSEETGETLSATDLDPDTEYRVIVAGTDNFDQIGWATTTFRTNPAPEFYSLGYGIYSDGWLGMADAKVEILKADTDPARYIVKDPYEEFWGDEEPWEEGNWGYNGNYSSEIEFYLDGEEIHYNPIYNGIYSAYYGAQIAYYSEVNGNFGPNNIAIQEGVYNIAPYLMYEGVGYATGALEWWGQNYIVLPGYEYDPSAAGADGAGAPAKRSYRNDSSLSPLAPVTVIRPFTGETTLKRHMLKGGVSAPKAVEASRSFVEITK